MLRETFQILHCLRWVADGGVEERRATISERLDSAEFHHILLCQTASGPIRQRLEARGWTVIELGAPTFKLDFGWLFRARTAVKGLSPDIIHGAVSEGNLLATFLAGLFPSAKVVTEETSDGVGRRPLGRLLAKIVYLRSDAVVAVSPAVEAYLKEDLKIPHEKVHLIMNGVESPRSFSQEEISHFREDLGIVSDSVIIGSVGRLVDSHKGFSKLIFALPRLVSEFPNLVLLVVGDGPDRESLKELSEELGVHEHVVFAGYREKTQPIFQIMSVFSLASSMEAFGLVVAEAMLARVPVVAASVGGIPDILENGHCGILVEGGSPEEYGSAIALLLNNPELSSDLRERAYQRAVTTYAADNYVSSLRRFWNTLLG